MRPIDRPTFETPKEEAARRPVDNSFAIGVGLVVALLLLIAGLTLQTSVTTGLLTAALGLATVGAFVWLLRRSLLARQKAAGVLYEQREWFRLTLA